MHSWFPKALHTHPAKIRGFYSQRHAHPYVSCFQALSEREDHQSAALTSGQGKPGSESPSPCADAHLLPWGVLTSKALWLLQRLHLTVLTFGCFWIINVASARCCGFIWSLFLWSLLLLKLCLDAQTSHAASPANYHRVGWCFSIWNWCKRSYKPSKIQPTNWCTVLMFVLLFGLFLRSYLCLTRCGASPEVTCSKWEHQHIHRGP